MENIKVSRKTIQVTDDVKKEIQKIREGMGVKNESQVIQAMLHLIDKHFLQYHFYLCKVAFEEANIGCVYEEQVGRDVDGNLVRKDEIKKFFDTETNVYDFGEQVGYLIHLSRSSEYAACAVVEDQDGFMELVDVGDSEFSDFDDFISLIVRTYEEN